MKVKVHICGLIEYYGMLKNNKEGSQITKIAPNMLARAPKKAIILCMEECRTDNINIKVATENFISQSDGPTIL